MEDLKQALFDSPALRPIDYESHAPVILAVDTSIIAVGFYLTQCNPANPWHRHFNRFCSITLNNREARFSQPKLELYGLYRALQSLRLYLIGVRNLIVEVDAKYIKGMLQNPDIAPNATINRWIVAILLFHFTLVHVPGIQHGPDGLSRRLPQKSDDPDNAENDDEFQDWVDNMHGFMHMINPTSPVSSFSDHSLAMFLQATDLSQDQSNSDDLHSESNTLSYSDIPRPDQANNKEERLQLAQQWLSDLQRPLDMSDDAYAKFIRYSTHFFKDGNRLWCKDSEGAHKLVVDPEDRLRIIRTAHDDIGHKGFYATRTLIMERFWWPHMQYDISWFVRTCHHCQVRQTRQVLLPPTVATPAPLFLKMYADTMHMPTSAGYRYILQGRCSLSAWPEFRKLRSENGRTIGEWLFEDVLCRWGSLREIVTDNGTPFIKALDYLAKKYGIQHICVSGYNHRANGLVERSHFDIRQSLYKAADGNEKAWSSSTYSVFWADRVTVRRRMGCSPYFAVTGSHPLLPLDILEATYLMPLPNSLLSTTDLIARCAITLQKRSEDLSRIYDNVFKARREAALRFEKEHKATIRNFNFKRGDLVLMRNSQIELSHSAKMQPRYLGPLLVVSRNRGGSYILCELDGAVLHRPIAAFRVIPYLPRKAIPLPPDLLDVDNTRLRSLEETDEMDT